MKALCAFLIVCIHSPFPGVVGEYFTVLTRIAVPIFLIITGYYFKQENARKQIKKVAILFLEANMLYFIWNVTINLLKGQLVYYIKTTVTVDNAFRFVIFNETHFAYHLWYLGAVLYVLIIMCIVSKIENNKKWNLKKVLYIITPILLIGDLILGKYSLVVFQQEFPVAIIRNWLFVGLPYFTIGLWLKERRENFNKLMTKSITVTVMILMTGTSVLERLLLVENNLLIRQ